MAYSAGTHSPRSGATRVWTVASDLNCGRWCKRVAASTDTLDLRIAALASPSKAVLHGRVSDSTAEEALHFTVYFDGAELTVGMLEHLDHRVTD